MIRTKPADHRRTVAFSTCRTGIVRKWLPAFSLATLLLLHTAPAGATPLNILYYGNSFVLGDGNVPTLADLVSSIATAAGHDTPYTVNASIDGADFGSHLAINTPVINDSAPVSGQWDVVVMQDYSTGPTSFGNLLQHRSNAVSLYQAVAAHSGGVVPVMFETWARGPGHYLYTGVPIAFPGGPTQMQEELREGYQLSAGDIDMAHGSAIAKIAGVGDAFEGFAFDANLYDSEGYHASYRGMLLAALVLYSTIYDDPTTDDIDLSGVMASLFLTPQEGYFPGITVPEPSSAVLGLLAAAGLWVIRRRRVCHPNAG